MRAYFIIVFVILFFAIGLQATPLALDGFITAEALGGGVLVGMTERVYQNSGQNPCVFYGPGDCTDLAGWNEVGPTTGNFDLRTGAGPNAGDDFVITVGELREALGFPQSAVMAFLLGVDLNQSGSPQTNLIISVSIGDAMYFDIAMPSIVASNPGTGWADYVGAIAYDSTTGVFTPIQIGPAVSDDSIIQFRFALNANDGADQLFLIPAAPSGQVPEPAAYVLMGGGLIGLSLLRRFRG